MEASIIEINTGRIVCEDDVYEFTLGFCEDPYPHVTMDYRVLPGGIDVVGFAGRSPGALLYVLNREGYPVPNMLRIWSDEAAELTERLLSGSSDKTLLGLRSYYTSYSEAAIESVVRECMSEKFCDASVSLALHTYKGIKAADAWNARLDELLNSG
ncbi:hypothetical protein J5I95_15825 [Candidatus Poribacteria bacterium]|nr:hypothetical protein [Candidatus Poribacteria bacterium]